jgi:hypothetical protein
MEVYHTDPLEQPDMNACRTELAFRLADGTPQAERSVDYSKFTTDDVAAL